MKYDILTCYILYIASEKPMYAHSSTVWVPQGTRPPAAWMHQGCMSCYGIEPKCTNLSRASCSRRAHSMAPRGVAKAIMNTPSCRYRIPLLPARTDNRQRCPCLHIIICLGMHTPCRCSHPDLTQQCDQATEIAAGCEGRGVAVGSGMHCIGSQWAMMSWKASGRHAHTQGPTFSWHS